ncbi:MAG: hypothetical protein HFF43_00595 [Lawsonibacter sp.]|jgi:uncharacterized protein YjdB|nr:hypothetical protein [Lawsonibacter sp.]
MKNSLGRRWMALFLTVAMCLTLAPAVWAADSVVFELESSNVTIKVGEQQSLKLEATEEDGTAITTGITWSSDNSAVATVDNNGQVTAKSAGTAKITASYTAQDTKTYTSECTVTVEAASTPDPGPAPGDTLVELTGALNKNTVEALKTGDTDTLSFTVTAKWGDGNTSTVSQNAAYSWSIGNSNIATITPNLRTNSATLKGVNPGTTTVTVTATYKDKTTAAATCTVTVIQRMGSIRITPTGPLTMEENEQQELKATTDPAGEVVTWSVTDTEPEGSSTASVQATNSTGQGAIVYANSPGRATITASIGEEGNQEKQTIIVEVSGLVLDPEAVDKLKNLTENEKLPIPGVTRYGNAVNGRAISWQTQDNTVAEVSGSSVVGRGPGSTTITGYCGAYTASFTVTVSAGQSTIEWGTLQGGYNLPFSSLTGKLSGQVSGTLSHLTSLSVPTNQGTLYYNYISEAQRGQGVAQRDSYYLNPKNGQLDLKNVTFVPNPSYSGPAVITYNAFSTTGEAVSCRIMLTVEQEETPTFSLNTKYNTPVKFSSTEFNRACQRATNGTLDYVTFSLPSERQGKLYTNYVSENNYGTQVTLNTRYRLNVLDDVWFIPAPGYIGTVTIYYTGYVAGTSNTRYNGQIVITVDRETSSGIGGPAYDAPQGGAVALDDRDFQSYCEQLLSTRQTLNYIRFDSLPSASEGTLYYDYRSSGGRGTPVSQGTNYYYGSYSPRLDRITFLCAEDFSGTVRIPFTGCTNDGTTFTGNVEINVRDGGGSGNIQYTCAAGRSVSFNTGDFTRLCRSLTDRTLDYIRFQSLPSSADGVVYYGNNTRANTSTSYRNSSSGTRISNLSFRASNSFSGSIDIPFVGYASGDGGTFNGVITISSDGAGGSRGDISYTTDSGVAAVFNRDDFDDLSQWETDRNISTVRFELPSTSQGELYRGYRSSSSKGTRITSSNTSISASELDRVAFIPASGFSGTVNIYFQARSTNSEEFEGMVEVQVERPSAAVTVRYSTRSAPVGFRGSDFGRSGSNLSSIRFSSMPASTAGHLYYRYTSPTRYDRQASTASSYNVSGSNLISDLSFVPKAGFSGTVVLPYTGTNSNNSTFEGEVVITVAPSYTTSYFNDLGQYDNQQRAAVEYLYDNGITAGVSATQYGPERSITRGDFALMVYKAFGMSPAGASEVFNDVPRSAYYAQAVNTLYAQGVVSGIGGGNYGPGLQVTREDALIMVRQAMRTVGWSAGDGYASTLDSYSDGGSVSGYAQGAVSYALQMGYLPVSGGRIAPKDPLTRIAMAEVLHRVLTY